MTPETQTILLSLVSAVLAACSSIAIMRVLVRLGSFALAQVANAGNVIFLGLYGWWVFDVSIFRWEAFAWFGLLGIFNFGINRWVFYTGMRVMGPSRHITITSLTPLPALIIAVFALGERPGTLIIAGTGLVVVGIIAASYAPSEGRWFQAGIGWSLTAMMMFAVGGYMRNRGMNLMPASALLTAWAAFVAIPTGEVMRKFVPKRHFSWEGAAWSLAPLIILAIVFNSVQQVLMNIAIKRSLSLAVPIMSATPVFVMILSAIFLRDIERLNRRVVLGITITFIGMAAIGIGRHG